MYIFVTHPTPVQITTVYKSPSCLYQQFQKFVATHLLNGIDTTQPFIIIRRFNSDIQKDKRINDHMTSTFN